MPIKKKQYTYRGLNQDVSKSKHPFEFYYDANNIRIITTDTQSTGSVTNEKGNELVLTIPTVCVNTVNKEISYNSTILPFKNDELIEQVNLIDTSITNIKCSGKQIIIGNSVSDDSIILFSTDDRGFDCIWEVTDIFTDDYNLRLLYIRNLGFSKNNPIQTIFNFESNIIKKVYWVNGKEQISFINIEHSIENGDLESLIDLNFTNIHLVGDYNVSQPIIDKIVRGGSHTSGMIQYGFNLYRLNGSQTTISPLSSLQALDLGSTLGGGEINENVSSTPIININNIDERFTHIKIYAVKYTSYNTIPSVSIIHDSEISNYNKLIYFDTGFVINTVSLPEFIFLGGTIFTPEHIASKDNRLFAANITDKEFEFDIDCRAYSFSNAGNSILSSQGDPLTINNVPAGPFLSVPIEYNVSLKHDSINPDYSKYKFQKNGITKGGEGKYLKYELTQTIASDLNNSLKYNKFFKDDEYYRLGIKFYNKLGQYTSPKWIADIKSNNGNLEGKFNTLKVTLNLLQIQNFITSNNLSGNNIPVGYKIIRADRTELDKTIICQGALTGMMLQSTDDVSNYEYWTNWNNRRYRSNEYVKIPIPLTRGFTMPSSEQSVFHTEDLKQMNEGRSEGRDEIYRDTDRGFKIQQSWQYTKMMQMYSPESLFINGLNLNGGLKLKVKGTILHTETNLIKKVIDINTQNIKNTYVFNNMSNLLVNNFGVFGPSYGSCEKNEMYHFSFNRKYKTFINNNSNNIYNIYGSPESTERGQGVTLYNNDSKYKYNNSLTSFLSDTQKGGSYNSLSIYSLRSMGSKTITIVLGNDDTIENNRPTLESIAPDRSLNGLVLAELTKDNSSIYTDNIYGGISYEAKSRSTYIEIGEYKTINISEINIESPGDTFVQLFKIGRILKEDTIDFNCRTLQHSEIVEFYVETSVNLYNRNDLSLLEWDNKFQPRYDEYHKYNRVYSQSPNLLKDSSENFKLKKIHSFNTKVMASKIKLPGEIIDSWTDFAVNETISLDGKYGKINSLHNYKDTIFTLQEKGIARLSINPRVQIQSTDGMDIEIGAGRVLHDYTYISTISGTSNKWSVIQSPSGFYYLDVANKSWNKYQEGQGILNLTDKYGLHGYFERNINFNTLVIDNPLIKKGVSGGYDILHNMSYLTLLQEDKTITLSFNEASNSFESFHDYHPSMYINKGYKLLTTSPDINKIYEHGKGKYQTFYEKKYPSYIVLQVNPESNLDCIFNNIEYKSEIYLNDIDQPQNTLTHISAWNEYQKTNRIPLKLSRSGNLRRKFRNWSAQIPREAGTRNRIRNPWVFLKLELDTTEDYKMVLHDILIHYTV